MYNDFDSDAGQWSYLREDLPKNNTYDFNYSGETECVCCGEIDNDFEDESSLRLSYC